MVPPSPTSLEKGRIVWFCRFSIADGECAPQDLIWGADEIPLAICDSPALVGGRRKLNSNDSWYDLYFSDLLTVLAQLITTWLISAESHTGFNRI